MARRIILALFLTFALVFAARRLSERGPKDVYVEEGDIRVWHRTVTEVIVKTLEGRELNLQPFIKIKVEGPVYLRKIVEFKSEEKASVEHRRLIPQGNNEYSAYLPPLPKGQKIWYAIVLQRQDGTEFRIPRGSNFYEVRFKGEVSKGILVAHGVSMFAAFFFMILSFLGAIGIIRTGEGKRHTVSAARLALVFAFIGTVPLGFVLNKQTFGVLWEGWPFGRDITDNKTQIVILLWLLALLLVRGSAFWGGEAKDILDSKRFAWLVIVGFVASLALYLVPHSL